VIYLDIASRQRPSNPPGTASDVEQTINQKDSIASSNIESKTTAMMASNGTPANDDFHKLFLVVKDLAQQLDENRQATAKLKLHADLLKEQLRVYKFGESAQNGQHESSVRKFMTNPITKGIEGNAIDDLLNERDELARENQFLRRELDDMGDLVRDYEKGMQAITASIRDHAVRPH